MITTILADDHQIVRQGLRAVLEAEAGCEIVGEAADGRTALDLIVTRRPQIAVLDVQLPDLSGLEVARRARGLAPETRVVMLSMHADEPYVLDALHYGAMGYVLKGEATTDLIAAVHAVLAGRRFLSEPLAERAIDAYARRASREERPIDRYDLLTPREREVLPLAAQGLNNVEIGERLSISPRTVETHRTNFLRKLGIESQTGLVHFAMQRGVIPGGSG